MNTESPGCGADAPIIFYYTGFTDPELFCALVEDRFRRTGHERAIDFRPWNCFKQLPGTDGDLFLYDGIVLRALVDKGFLRPLPGNFCTEDVFRWVTKKSWVMRKIYAVPVMLCSNALICRAKDDQHVHNVMELQESVAIPMRSMVMFYFIQAFFNNRTPRQSVKVMEHLLELNGGRDALEKSSLSEYDGINRFNRGECRYLLGFTEFRRYLNQDDYALSFANFSAKAEAKYPIFMSDFASVGRQVREDKLQDCLDLLRILSDEEFVYDLCTLDGVLQYFIPAHRKLYPRLAELDPLYDRLFELLDSDSNGLMYYGKRFYEDFYLQTDMLLQYLWEKAGWKPD